MLLLYFIVRSALSEQKKAVKICYSTKFFFRIVYVIVCTALSGTKKSSKNMLLENCFFLEFRSAPSRTNKKK